MEPRYATRGGPVADSHFGSAADIFGGLKEVNMAKRRKSLGSITAEQAHQALTFLVHKGRITTREVEKALKNRERLIREIRERMAALGADAVRTGARLTKRAAKGLRAAGKAARPARRRAVSAATKAARQAQGRYMAAVRRLSKDARKQILELRRKSGVRAAIAAAKRMAS
jgi:hypothetical protein